MGSLHVHSPLTQTPGVTNTAPQAHQYTMWPAQVVKTRGRGAILLARLRVWIVWFACCTAKESFQSQNFHNEKVIAKGLLQAPHREAPGDLYTVIIPEENPN